MHSNNALVAVSSSLSGNRENTSDDLRTNSLEMVLDATVRVYRFDSPKLELGLDGSFYVNLTTAGRYRVVFDGRLSIALIADLSWDVSQVYCRYDSQPSGAATTTSDWGVVSGIRYSFD